MSKTQEYITSFTPRGRWILGKYVKTYGDTTSMVAYIYQVVDPGGVAEVSVGDLLLIDPNYSVQVGEGYAYINFDDGVYAKWNSSYDEPVLLYASISAEPVDWLPDLGIGWFGDAIAATVLDLDTTTIKDITAGQEVLVPRRFVVNVGKRSFTRIVFRAKNVLAVK